jgi:alanine racemase
MTAFPDQHSYGNGYSYWLEIDLGAICGNIQQLKQLCGVPVMAVVKARGYGHGLVETALAAEKAGSPWCGVARLEEAVELRKGGYRQRILVLGYTSPLRVPEAMAHHISLTVYDLEMARGYAAQAQNCQGCLPLHVKFDTGMGRLGLPPEGGIEFLRWLSQQPGLKLEGVYTHFARADEPAVPTTGWQLKRFVELINGVEAAGLRPEWVHACNSAGALCYPAARFDLVRIGIAIYGLNPSPEVTLPAGMRPALTWKTRLTSLKVLPTGHGVSYGHRYFTVQDERIGVIAAGYADGLRRMAGNIALVGGQRVPVVGSVCMDQCMLQLTHLPDARIGDEAVLIGSQGSESIRADDLARNWGTINYEVVCGLDDRLPRVYLNG